MSLSSVMTVCLGALVAASNFPTTPPSHFHLVGDYILGGLFSLHAEAVTSPFLSYAQVPLCKLYQLKIVSYSYLQAMRFAVEEINSAHNLLPGVSLGYEMVDVCYLTNIIHPVLYFLSDANFQIPIERNYTHYQPRVVAVIGPDSSPASVTMAHILSQFLVPQISYSATTEDLSNPKLFPGAFRTIPTTEQQVTVMLKLLQRFKWNWVIVISSDDDYGQQNLRLLRSQASWTCIAFQETIPVTRVNQNPEFVEERVKDIIAKIAQSSANVVLILSLELHLESFFQEAIRQNITELVWIASEAWAIDPYLHSISNISSIGTIFGVAVQDVPIPGFSDFRIRLPSSPTEGAETHTASKTCNQECSQCLAMSRSLDESIRGTGDRIDFNVYSAVYVVAHALHQLLGCTDTECHKRTVYPWQLLKAVGQVNFTLLNTTINFNEKGDPPNGFEVIQWRWDAPGRPFMKIATYDSLQDQLHVYREDIVWHTANKTAPTSTCSEHCGPGERKKVVGLASCCFQCVKCEAGTFLNKSDNFTCQHCPPDMWSTEGQEDCFKRVLTYLCWEDPAAIMLMLWFALGLLITLGILATFVRHSDTPVVRSAGGRLCFLMIASILVSVCSTPLYIGMPTELKCVLRQMVFSMCFTLCVACFTVRSFQILCAFKMATQLPRAYEAWMKHNGQKVFIAAIFLAKVILMAVNFAYHRTALVEPVVSSDPAILVVICSRSYRSSTVIVSAFDMVLSFLCFCFAYMGKALPKNYNEAKYITLCITLYFTSWVSLFIVLSLVEGLLVTVFDAASMLFNLFSILLGYFGPKCYVILFHPERNTAAFFQTAIQTYTMRQE